MEALYDIQQPSKQSGIYIYVGTQIYDIELMVIELKKLHEDQLVSRDTYSRARHILQKEHQIEELRGKQKRID